MSHRTDYRRNRATSDAIQALVLVVALVVLAGLVGHLLTSVLHELTTVTETLR